MQLNFVSFHGLYSQGNNLEILVNALEFEAEKRGIDVVTSQHDYPMLKIWQGRKRWAREIVKEYMLKCLALEYRKFPKASLVLLCHSNATFGIMNVLNSYYYEKEGLYDKIKIDSIMLFGSVIPKEFDWNRFSSINVVNFVGRKDIVSGFAGKFYGMGSSGKKGFKIKAYNLKQVYTKWRHSDFVLEKNFDIVEKEVFSKVIEIAPPVMRDI